MYFFVLKIIKEKGNQVIIQEAVRYLIECYMRVEQKEKASDLFKSEEFSSDESLMKELSSLVIKYYTNDLISALEA